MSSQPVLPGQDVKPDDALCGKCGRFTGALNRCPHCGARVEKKMSLRAIRWAAVLLATVGLGLLYLMARSQVVPFIQIGEITPTMNFGYVRIKGVVNGDARIFKQGGSLRSVTFYVDDGTGEIPVRAYKHQAEVLVARNQLPRSGDQIEVAGSLSVSADDNIALRLQIPEQLVLQRLSNPSTLLAALTEERLGENVTIAGTITRVQPPRPGAKMPWVVEVEDASDRREITFWDQEYADIENKLLLAPGTPVRVRVNVDRYRGNLQLRLASGRDWEFPATADAAFLVAGPGAPPEHGPRLPLTKVTPAMVDASVVVSGRVAAIRHPTRGSKEPTTVKLRDGATEVDVVYWDKVATQLGVNRPTLGALMEVEGYVGVYQDKIQIRAARADRILVLDAMPASEATVKPDQAVPVASITAEMVGQLRTVRGVLGRPDSLKSGIRFDLKDDTGTMDLVLWDSRVPGPYRADLVEGARVVVLGEVMQYKGTMEIVPPAPQAIQVEK